MTETVTSMGKQFIHYNPERTDYSVTAEEIARIETSGANLWKDMCLVSGPLGTSCLINAIIATPAPFKLSLGLFLNYLLGCLGVCLCIVFAIAWYKTAGQLNAVIRQIKEKPKMEIIPSTTNIGSLETTPIANQ